MTTHTHIAVASATTHIAARAFEIALGLAIVAALTGAWLAFFTFVPLDLTPHR